MNRALSPADYREPTLAEDGGAYSAAPAGPGGMTRDVPMIREYLIILGRRKWIILAIVAISLLVGLVATLLMTPQFTAASRIEISRQQQRVTNVEGLEQSDRTFDAEFYDTQYELLRARSVAERVAEELRLANNFQFFAAHGIDPETTEWLGSPDAAPSRETLATREDAAVGLLLGHVNIAPIARSALVDIAYTSADPTIAASVANEWATQFMTDSMERRFASTADAREYLERRLAELRQRVEESQTQLVNYANDKDIVVLDRVEEDGRTVSTPTLVQANLQAMNSALAEATQQRLELEARAGAARGTNADLVNSSTVNTLRQRRSDLEAEYARLMVQFEPGYPAARALQDQIQSLDQAIAREEGRVRQSTQSDYQAAVQREANLRSRVEDLTQRLSLQERDRIQYNIFQNEVDTNRELYDGLLQRYKEIGVAGVAANNIALVDRAQVPGAPSSPNLPLNLLVALFGGMVLSGLAVFALEQFDEGIRDPSQITPLTGLPLLGAIPVTDENVEVAELVQDAKSEVSEAYLTVRSNLAFSTDHGVPKSLMVTSTRPAEGKSTSAFALATVLARTGKRVILIDADMRSPSVHGLFGIKNDVGFSSFLTGQNDITSLLRETDIANLSLMTAGRTPPSAAELLSGDRAHELIELLTQRFDHVVVDAPPLLGLADSPLLAQAVEGVVYVIEAKGVAARGINLSLDRLRNNNANLLGGIFTKFTGSSVEGYGYGYGYGYGLRYGAEDEVA